MSAPDGKRRLPILQQGGGPAGEDPGEERPAWHWSIIGTATIFLVWLPLAALAARVDALSAMIGLQLAAFLTGTFAGGFFVGRFGGKAGSKEATVSGFAAAALGWALGVAAPGRGPGAATWALLLVFMGGLGATTARLGGRFGYARRHPAERR